MNHVAKSRFVFESLIGVKSGVLLVNRRFVCVGRCLHFSRIGSTTVSGFEKPCVTYVSYVQKRFAKRQSFDKNLEVGNREAKNEDDEVVKDYKDYKIGVSNPRVDSIVRKVTGFSKSKFDAAFYEGRIYVNDEKLTKKSAEVSEDDVIDFIIGNSQDNREMLNVIRIIALDVPDLPNEDDKYVVKVRRFQNLLIDNYEIPWKAN